MELTTQSSFLAQKPPSSPPFQPSLHNLKTTRLTINSTNSTEEPNKPITKTSVGFGSSSSSLQTTKDGSKRKGSSKVIRRTPLDKPAFLPKQTKTQTPEPSGLETAFLLTWFGLGSLIIVEGLVLAASGLFPEEWDKYFVKYLYPAFTPTVFLFVAGTVVYGVLKYLEVEKTKS